MTPSEAPSFAQLCHTFTYAGCGCGMCKEGDICPTPVLRPVDIAHDETAAYERLPGAVIREWDERKMG